MRHSRLLTIICFAAVLLVCASFAQAAVDKVICVPWQGNPTRYHTAISGQPAKLKAVIRTTDTSTVWYKWVFGDGTESSALGAALSGKTKYNVEINHTYTGAD